MNLRKTIVAVVASGLLAAPAAASASPAPEPPPRTTDTVQVAVDELVKAYARARLSDRRTIHNEIVLLINVGRAAL